MLIMMCLTQDNLEKQKSGSDLNVQHTEMVKKMITYIIYGQLVFNKGAKTMK